MFVFVVGLLLVAVLSALKVRGALLISIIASTVIAVIIEAVAHVGGRTDANPHGWALNVPTIQDLVALPNFGLIGRVDLIGAFAGGANFGTVVMLVLLIFSLLLADFFDTMGTVVAVGAEGHLLQHDGNPPHLTGILVVDSLSAVAGGVGSVSSNTTFIESASGGVAEGGRGPAWRTWSPGGPRSCWRPSSRR